MTSPRRNEHRPKRSSSQNVNYSLKVRKVIQPFDNRASNSSLTTPTTSSTSSFFHPTTSHENSDSGPDSFNGEATHKPLSSSPTVFKRDSKGRIIGENVPVKDTTSTTTVIGSCSDDANNRPIDADIVSIATGLPLSSGPTEKIRREALWNYKKSSSTNSTGLLVPSLSSVRSVDVDYRVYKQNLKTQYSDTLTKPSWIRYTRALSSNTTTTISDKSRSNKTDFENHLHGEASTNSHHIKIKLTELRNSKLFGQNSAVNSASASASASASNTSLNVKSTSNSQNSIPFSTTKSPSLPTRTTSVPEIENEDFCSACLQPGIFICCDTCPKSFHFLCLDPPIDPNHLPEGDWSCPKCLFNQRYPSMTRRSKAESLFLKGLQQRYGTKIFGKLLFDLQNRNPQQFELPFSIKSTFEGVKTGERGQYSDANDKVPLSYGQLYEYPYGQSPTQFDRYVPECHFDSTLDYEGSDNFGDGDNVQRVDLDKTNGKSNVDSQFGNDRFLICYRCNMTRMGTWDHPENSRVIIRCDYCGTPWHLDCVPDFPRASLKNLGRKWKCPLHSSVSRGSSKSGSSSVSGVRRRLNRHLQKFYEPLQLCNFKNDGDIEVKLVEESVNDVETRGSESMLQNYKDEKYGDALNPIPVLSETAIKLDFCSKILNYKRIEQIHGFKMQNALLDKLIRARNTDIESITNLIYFRVANCGESNSLRKQWNLKELCLVAEDALASIPSKNEEESRVTGDELKQLLAIKKLIESKPKEDVIKFFGLDEKKK